MEYNYNFKIILVGNSGTGKSNISSRFLINQFDHCTKSTIGVEFSTKDIHIEKDIIRVQLWDTAGQERYKSIVISYYRGALGIMLVYDITKRDSFDNLQFWIDQINQYCPNNIKIIIIGNKQDLNDKRVISTEEGRIYAKTNNALFMEVSALQNFNIQKAIELLVYDIYFAICDVKKDVMLDTKSINPNIEKVKNNIIIENGKKIEINKKSSCC